MSRILLFILFSIWIQLVYAQKHKAENIKKDLQNLEGFENAFVGFALYDPDKDVMLASHYADKHMTPASNTKLFTFWGTDSWLPTQLDAFYWAQNPDSLVFWSSGYPLTLHPEHPDSTLIHFLNGIPEDKKVFYWIRPNEIERFGSGWGWDDFGGYYGAEMSLFPIYGNSVQFIINNEKRTYSMTPDYQGFKVKVSNKESNRTKVHRDEFWNEFEIQFDSTLNTQSPIDTLIRPFRYSDQLFVELLEQVTEREITLASQFPIQHLGYYDYHKIEIQRGVHKDSLYKWMLQPSDNLLAEALLLMASGTYHDTLSTPTALNQAQAFREEIESPYLSDELVWVDGSGLSRYNMFKPSEMIGVLKSLYDDFSEERLFDLLPQGGVSGTLEDSYKMENGEPYVFAKTGTLSNNHSLSGYIKTKKGKTLIFSLMANHYTCPTSQVIKNFESILKQIRITY